MRQLVLSAAALLSALSVHGAAAADAPTVPGPYARIAILRPHDGKTVDFESGYVRHLAWHRDAGDPWAWYGWSIWAGERQRWFVYATFGRTPEDLDHPVAPADDEKDNLLNVEPHVQWIENGLYEFLPELSRGNGVPSTTPRLELTTVHLAPGAEKAFEGALAAAPGSRWETLWFRMLAGGDAPKYVRLRPKPAVSAVLAGAGEQALPRAVNELVKRMSVEILTFRPAMSLGLHP
jgi:hypothetical protein